MKIIAYTLYALWALTSIVLKILGLVSWWVATSFLWIPLSIILTIIVGINVSVWIGSKLKAREESKIPDGCEACLFGQTRIYADEQKCLGEVMDEKNTYGTLCPYYKRHTNPK